MRGRERTWAELIPQEVAVWSGQVCVQLAHPHQPGLGADCLEEYWRRNQRIELCAASLQPVTWVLEDEHGNNTLE